MVRLQLSLVGIGLLLMSTLGCHNLQSHRLQRLNRGMDGMPTSGYFSVSDPIEKDIRPTLGQTIASNEMKMQSTD